MRTFANSTMLCLLLLGCDDVSTPAREALEQELGEARAATLQAEEDLRSTREHLVARIAALEGDLAARTREHQSAVRDYEQRLKLKDQRVLALEEAVRREQAHAQNLQADLKEKAAVVKVLRVAPPAPLPFPLEISEVRGRHVAVAARTRPRPVEGDEVYRDAYGNKKPVIEYEEVTEQTYEFQVTFVARNLTDTPQTFWARAGHPAAPFKIDSAGVLTNATIQSARGSGLFIECDGNEQRYHVTY